MSTSGNLLSKVTLKRMESRGAECLISTDEALASFLVLLLRHARRHTHTLYAYAVHIQKNHFLSQVHTIQRDWPGKKLHWALCHICFLLKQIKKKKEKKSHKQFTQTLVLRSSSGDWLILLVTLLSRKLQEWVLLGCSKVLSLFVWLVWFGFFGIRILCVALYPRTCFVDKVGLYLVECYLPLPPEY